MRRKIVSVLGGIVLLGVSTALASDARPDKTAKTIRSLGVKWLVKNQNVHDGSYGKKDDAQVGKTALVVWVLASCQRGYQVVDGPYMSEAVAFILRSHDRDGTFGKCGSEKVTRFNTAMAVKALSALKSAADYKNYIAKGAAYLAMTSGTKPSTEVWGGLGAVWPDTPGPVCRTLMQNTLNVQMRKGGAWLAESIKTLSALQDGTDDEADTYGMCKSETEEGVETDPVVATAMAVKAADLVKDNYKNLKDLK